MTFTIGVGNTCGMINLSGTLEAAMGATIEVDVSNLTYDATVQLVEACDLSGFNADRVALKGDTKHCAVKKIGNGLYVKRSRPGMTITIR